MDLARAEHLALELMARWLDGKGIRFEWTDSLAYLGQCRFENDRPVSIRLSRKYVRANSEDLVLDTIKHEIAHALAGAVAGHGPVWKRWARVVGARPETRKKIEQVNMPDHPYHAKCLHCNKIVAYFSRRPDVKLWSERRCCKTCGIKVGKLAIFKKGS